MGLDKLSKDGMLNIDDLDMVTGGTGPAMGNPYGDELGDYTDQLLQQPESALKKRDDELKKRTDTIKANGDILKNVTQNI